MRLQNQRGSLSLLWAAVFVGVVALMAMVALISARHERNYFTYAWEYLSSRGKQELLQAAQAPIASGNAVVRKCTVAGKIIYSNVECNASNPTSREVVLQETKGFEAPKPAPNPAAQTGVEPSLQDKAIERTLGR
ncbi:hypothetical protein [Noviherbaspirillum agri]